MRVHALMTPPPAVLDDLAVAVENAAAAGPGVPWLPRHEWQIKLAYFGNLGLTELLAVRATLAQIGSFCPPLGLRLAGAEARPDQEGTESLVLGLAGDLAELWSLAGAIPAMVQRHGLFLDRRAFRADLTIAHAVREPFDSRRAVAALATYQGLPWIADDMHVVRWVPGGDDEDDGWEDVERYKFTAPREDRATQGATPAGRHVASVAESPAVTPH